MSVVVAAIVVATAYAFSAQPTPRLRLQVEDYAQLPITGELDGENTRGQLARVNFLRDEPGGRRFFVNDLNGPLYILDKQTKQTTVYLDFNGLGGRPGLFPKFTFERNFATGLTNFLFNPDYAQNGVFYTMHMEDPDGAGCPGAEARRRGRPGPDGLRHHAGDSDADRQRSGIAREVVLIGSDDRNPANANFEGTARELLRLQHPLPAAPVGQDDLQPGRAARRSRLAGHVHRRRRLRLGRPEGQPPHQPATARHARRKDCGASSRTSREHTTTSTVSENGGTKHQRQPVHEPRGRAQGDLGLRAAQPAPADLGRRSGPTENTAACWRSTSDWSRGRPWS